MVYVSRTNVVVDDELLAEVMNRYGFRTKREAIDFALRRLVGRPDKEGLLALQGMGWDGDLDAMRDHPVQEW
jgi:Arc/MetJ family transcription regulator